MKQFFTLLTLLALGVVYAQATDYGLTIGGKSITSAGDIDAGQSQGTINWDGKTLTFTNVIINYKGSNHALISYFGTEDFTVSFIGDNTIYSDVTILNSGSSKRVTIKGERNVTGSLTMALNDDADPRWRVIGVDGDLYIRFLYLTVIGKNYAITGNDNNKFDISETVLLAKAPTGGGGAVRNFASASFYAYDAYLTTGMFNTEKKAVCDEKGNPLQEVKTDASLFVNKVIVGVGYANEMGVYPKGLNAGSIKYAYKTNTLTLDGIDMKSSSTNHFIINKKLSGLKIVVKGTNTVNANGHWGIHSNKSFSVEGASSYSDDKLTINNSFGPLCLNPFSEDDNSSTMTLKNLTLDVKGTRVGIYSAAEPELKSTLTIDNCKGLAEVAGESEYSSIYGFTTCIFNGCGVNTATTPVFYNTAKKGCTNVLGTLAKKVDFDVPTTTYDGIKVLGTPVTNLNASNILVDGQTLGTISYDSSTKRLSLKEVNLEAPEGNTSRGFEISSSAVTEINVTDVNKITTQGDVIQTRGSGTITMTGTYDMLVPNAFHGTSTSGAGLTMDGSGGFVFDVDGSVRLKGKEIGIWGNGTIFDTSTVTMKNKGTGSDYYFQGEKRGAIVNVADLIMDGMDFFYNPSYGTPGCYFDNQYVRQNGGEIVKGNDVVNFFGVAKTYGITVAGTPVNSCNKMAVGSKYITGGGPTAVSYDADNNILTLEDATIEYSGDDKNFVALKNDGVDGLEIRLAGDNVINTSGYTALQLQHALSEKPVTTNIIGDGKLDAKSSWYAVRIGNYNTLDIGGNVQVKAEGTSSGIANNGLAKSDETLIIRGKALVKAKGKCSVQRLNDIQLMDGVKILEPAGAEIKKDDTYGWGVYVGGELTSEWVVFGSRVQGDVNGDGSVDVADIATVIAVMAAGDKADPALASAADVNDDGTVDVADIATVISIMAASARQMQTEDL